MTPQQTRIIAQLSKPLVFIISLLPLVWLFGLAWQNQLGANPVETITHHTGSGSSP
jgi:DMSO/TMAO reductase YedYZ heme-binding membrane subunit